MIAVLIIHWWKLVGWASISFLPLIHNVFVAIRRVRLFLPNLADPGSCPSDTDFICHSGQCIESHLVCDSKADCGDGSDELDCGEWRSGVGVREQWLSRHYSTWRWRSPTLEPTFGLPGACDFNLADEQWEETCQLGQNSDDDFDWRMSQHGALPPLGPYVDHSPGQLSF